MAARCTSTAHVRHFSDIRLVQFEIGERSSAVRQPISGRRYPTMVVRALRDMDENIIHRETGPVHAITLRLFNPESKEWSIYWSTNLTGTLDVPMMGSFKDGRGEFYSQEVFEGRHIYNHFIWSKITPSSCQWEQAFSVDGGKSWETNWIMEFERV